MKGAYEVLDITEMTRMTRRGETEQYYRHKLETKGGVFLTVDIDKANFTEEKAPPILLDKALAADKIKASTG